MKDLQNDIRTLQQKIALYEDMKAYETLYMLLSPRLKNFCYSLVKSNEAAEEIVSDVFIKLWQIKNKLPDIENLKVADVPGAAAVSNNPLRIACPWHGWEYDLATGQSFRALESGRQELRRGAGIGRGARCGG